MMQCNKHLFFTTTVVMFFCLASNTFSEQLKLYPRVGVSGKIPMGKLDEMEDALHLANAAQRANFLTRLGVDPAIAQEASQPPLQRVDITLEPLEGTDSARRSILFLPCALNNSAFAYLLQRSDRSAWHVQDSIGLDCWHDYVSHEFVALSGNKATDLVIHHTNAGHGSGYVADNLEVYAVRGDKFIKLFNTQEFLSQEELATETEHLLEQKSTFLLFPNHKLEETRQSSLNGRLQAIERRYWHRSSPQGEFTATPFVTVSGSMKQINP